MKGDSRDGWARLHETLPADGQVVEVVATRWREKKRMKFDAAASVFVDNANGEAYWYPHNMAWRPIPGAAAQAEVAP